MHRHAFNRASHRSGRGLAEYSSNSTQSQLRSNDRVCDTRSLRDVTGGELIDVPRIRPRLRCRHERWTRDVDQCHFGNRVAAAGRRVGDTARGSEALCLSGGAVRQWLVRPAEGARMKTRAFVFRTLFRSLHDAGAARGLHWDGRSGGVEGVSRRFRALSPRHPPRTGGTTGPPASPMCTVGRVGPGSANASELASPAFYRRARGAGPGVRCRAYARPVRDHRARAPGRHPPIIETIAVRSCQLIFSSRMTSDTVHSVDLQSTVLVAVAASQPRLIRSTESRSTELLVGVRLTRPSPRNAKPPSFSSVRRTQPPISHTERAYGRADKCTPSRPRTSLPERASSSARPGPPGGVRYGRETGADASKARVQPVALR
jgi:hypothetical protein